MASGGGRYSAKQWFAIKSKLRKQGRWDEKRAQKKDKDTLRPDRKGKSRVPVQKNTLDNYPAPVFTEVTDPAELAEVQAVIDNNPIESGKPLMSSNGRKQQLYFFSESDSDTGECNDGEICESNIDNTENELEGQSLLANEEMPDSPISILHEGRDLPRETWEIKRAFRNMQISSGTEERIRVAGIPETSGTIRDNTVILFRVGDPKLWYEVKANEEWNIESYTSYESYFQTYNSIAVVIRCLPDDYITTTDINEKLIPLIDDPYLLVCEKSDEGVLHWHMIWLTSKRSDNAKRILQKALFDLPGSVSISCQQTRSFKHLIRYLLKNPITLSVINCDALTKYTFALMKELDTTVKLTEENMPVDLANFPNQMVKDIIHAMNLHKKYTYEELVFYAPTIMQKYLHKPNLESIVSNCKLFLHRPNDTLLTFDRILSTHEDYVFTDLFPIWFWLSYQGINAGDFILDFWNVLFKLSDKRNVLTIQGPSNTGKTTFIRPLAEILNWGEIVQGGQFMFQNCINKELLLWEEPLIGQDYVEMCKRVFEGMTTQVNIKFKAPQTLYRTPIIITSNKDVWYYCDSDATALKNRMFLYFFNKNASIPTLSRRTVQQYYRDYCTWLGELGEYFCDSNQDDSSRTELSSTDRPSSESRTSREFHIRSLRGSELRDNPDFRTISGVNDSGRRSRSRSPIIECTKRSRPSKHDSTSVDSSFSGARTPTRDSPRRRSQSEERPSIYSSDIAQYRSDNRLGGGHHRPSSGRGHTDDSRRDRRSSTLLRENITLLRSFTQRYRSLKKVLQKAKLPSEPELDWETSDSCLDHTLFEPATKNQWLTLIHLGFNCAKSMNLL